MWALSCVVVLKFEKRLGISFVNASVKFQSATMIMTILSGLRGFMRYVVNASQDLVNMMTSSNGDIFRVIGHLCGTNASDAEL